MRLITLSIKNHSGFALPAVIMISGAILIMSLSILQGSLSIRSALANQHYNLLAREAAEAGLAYGVGCYNNGLTTWSELKPETPCPDYPGGDDGSGGGGGGGTPPADWWNTAWTERQKITFNNTGGPGTALIHENRIDDPKYDAEENIATGGVSIGSTDLELTTDGTANQEVGLRFRDVAVPKDALISKAYIQFTTDETGSGSTSVTIRGEATDQADYFYTTTANITSRPNTTASVEWDNIPAWNTIGESGLNQRSVDISPIIQEIIDRNGWVSNNDLALYLTGTGRRTAESYDGSPAAAPLLHVEYSVPTSEELADFPIRVSLDSSNVDYAKVQNAGQDIRFVDQNGTLLNHEIEDWNESDTSEVWVKVPQIDANSTTDHIFMYYNNPTAPDAQNVSGVWTNNYLGVWHMDGADGNGTLSESTSSNADLSKKTASGSGEPSNVLGYASGAQRYDASNDYAYGPSDTTLATGASFTLSASYIWRGTTTYNQTIVERGDNARASNNYYLQWTNNGSICPGGQHVAVGFMNQSGVWKHHCFAHSIQSDYWYSWVVTYDGVAISLYENGTLVGSQSETDTPMSTGSQRVSVGSASDGTQVSSGDIDNVSIASTARSAAWVISQYRSLSEAFTLHGPEEALNGGVLGIASDDNSPTATTVLQTGDLHTTFVVEPPVISTDGTVNLTARGFVNLTRKSDESVYRSYERTIKRIVQQGYEAEVLSRDRIVFDLFNNFVIAPDNKLYGTGRNAYGEVGDGTTTDRYTPVEVAIPGGATVKKVAANDYITFIITSTGRVYGVGRNNAGQLGNGTTANTTSFVEFQLPANEVAVSIEHEDDSTWVLTEDGDIYSAGRNWVGQLGDNSTTSRSTPVIVNMSTVPAGVKAKEISADTDTLIFLGTDNQMYGFGENSDGRLGNGTTTDQRRPVRFNIPAGLSVKSIHSVDENNYAITSDGHVYGAGDNSAGQLGNGTITDASTPVDMILPAGLVADTMEADRHVTAVLMNNGQLYTVGENADCQLGQGTCDTDVSILGLYRMDLASPAVDPSSTITMVGASNNNIWVLTSDGDSYGTGANWDGQIGDGTGTRRSTPRKFAIPSGKTIVAISSDNQYYSVLTSEGEVWGSGRNLYGQLGDGTNEERRTPVLFNLPLNAYERSYTSIIY